MTGNSFDYLGARAERLVENENRSKAELGENLSILTNGCRLLEHVAIQGNLRLRKGDASSRTETAILYLSFLIAWRAGTTTSLILPGFPTDAACLLRSMLEAYALQELFVADSASADLWLSRKQVPAPRAFKVISEEMMLSETWGQLSRVLHSNLTAIENQTAREGDGADERFVIGIVGSHLPEQMHRLVANFGVVVNKEITVAESQFGFAPTDGDRQLRDELIRRTEQLAIELRTRSPNPSS